MSAFDCVTFADLPRLPHLRIVFGYSWDLERLSNDRQVVLELPDQPVTYQVRCSIPVELDIVIRQAGNAVRHERIRWRDTTSASGWRGPGTTAGAYAYCAFGQTCA